MFGRKKFSEQQEKCFEKHIDLLGYRAKDKITGYEGVIDSVSFELYGCVHASVKPPLNKDGKVENGLWFDVTRLEVDKSSRVMPIPDFYEGYVANGEKGCDDKSPRVDREAT